MARRTIPEIRERLIEIGDELQRQGKVDMGAEIIMLANETTRRSPSRKRAPVHHKPLTDLERGAIKRFALANPDIHISEIAARFRTNPGRVSEALQRN